METNPLIPPQTAYNQMNPVSYPPNDIFQYNPTVITCPYCGQTVRTIVEEKINCCNCLFCMLGVIPWCIHKCCTNKPLGCSNATHSCPNCTKVVGIFNAC